ncbi:MAG: LemA family protein [Candidatus Berkelbacteria bacterium]|nr:MAG: LemA family protein [Candidatus Berkelbacteria bacterium]QQG51562.1 MAG: LemA family protein [Candidatus Berkelbacteria bacterium]
MSTLLWIIIAIAALVVIWFIATYNSLITLKNRVQEAWSDIDVQLKRRYDLIPNLIEAVKGYVKQEKDVLTQVTEARTTAMSAKSPHDKAQAENMLSETLKSLFAVSEAYPDLKSSQNFLSLQTELTDTEDKIQASRRFYNANVRDLNTKIETFPTNMIAGMVGAQKREFFEAAAGEKEPVKVQF